ncbi:hypothetical protein BP00DRAFT_35976 [Aspergillus indologenus CBS 114.80]|uniref:Uncharacterized protein n=1 Tax=Aspergillus indologenus CBS 114.80 TaxID=1450541 RepID=A0A2V5HY83_9EURO|nr:hypothetical protein BP00DRAFT_35976 [Aspergillus indologenus CBS 114.80]
MGLHPHPVTPSCCSERGGCRYRCVALHFPAPRSPLLPRAPLGRTGRIPVRVEEQHREGAPGLQGFGHRLRLRVQWPRLRQKGPTAPGTAGSRPGIRASLGPLRSAAGRPSSGRLQQRRHPPPGFPLPLLAAHSTPERRRLHRGPLQCCRPARLPDQRPEPPHRCGLRLLRNLPVRRRQADHAD